jgi:hypothetical protein
MAIPREDLSEIKVLLRDPDNQLVKMIDYIMHNANIGHSFEVVVDPELRESKRTFYMDGDGSFRIQEVRKDGNKVKVKDDKLIEGYLNCLQQ